MYIQNELLLISGTLLELQNYGVALIREMFAKQIYCLTEWYSE